MVINTLDPSRRIFPFSRPYLLIFDSIPSMNTCCRSNEESVKCSERRCSKPYCEIWGLANPPTSPFGNFADCTFNFGGWISVLLSRSSSSSKLFSHFIIMASHSSKIRILCLHGWMQNADIMTRNMDPIIKRFEGPVEFGKNPTQYNTLFIRPCVYIFLTLFISGFQ